MSEAFLKILNLDMSLSTYVILPVTVIITKNNFKPNLGTKAPNLMFHTPKKSPTLLVGWLKGYCYTATFDRDIPNQSWVTNFRTPCRMD